jgi:hypothetical protein
MLRRSIAIALLLAVASRAQAQRTSAQLSLLGGSSTDVRGLSSSAMTVAPSLTIAGARSALRLGLGGTGFAAGGWAAAGTAALEASQPLTRTFGLTLGGTLNGTRTSYGSSFVALDATPGARLWLAPLTLFAGLHAATGWSTFGAVTSPVPLAGPTAGATARSLAGAVFGGSLGLARRPAAPTLGYREEHSRVNGMPATDRSGTLALVRGPVSILGTLGARTEPGERTTFGGVRAEVALSRTLALQVGAIRYPGDRVTGTAGGRSITAGLSLHTPVGPRPLPRPAAVAPAGDGLTRLSIRAPAAATVEVAGDWSGWRPIATHRASNGVWYADLAIPRGTWRYAFRIDHREWRVPAGTTAGPDGFGGVSAWLTVAGDSQQ